MHFNLYSVLINYYIHMFMIPPLKLMIITRQAMTLVVHTDNGRTILDPPVCGK